MAGLLEIRSGECVTIFHYLAVAVIESDYFLDLWFFCYVTMLITFCEHVFRLLRHLVRSRVFD